MTHRVHARHRRPSLRTRVLLALRPVALGPFALGLLAAPALAQRPAGAPRPSLEAPSLVEWAVAKAAIGLTERREAVASKELLEQVRKVLAGDNAGTSREATLVLGFSQEPKDRAKLVERSQDRDAGLRERAMIALGQQGGSIATFHLGRVLDSREEAGRAKAIAALALGLASRDGTTSSQVNVLAQDLLRLGTRSHADELAATLFGFAGDSGREFLMSFLEGRSSGGAIKEAGASRSEATPAELHVLRSAMLASFATIAATQKEIRILLTEFQQKNQPDLLPFRVAWGLTQNDGRSMDAKQRGRLVQALEKRMRMREPEIAGMSLLAVANLDRKRGLAIARQYLASRTRRPRLLPAALLVLGRLGTAKDITSLREQLPKLESEDARAAWCLATAAIQRRLAPADWPLSGPIPGDVEVPEPLPQLRAFAAMDGGKPGRLQRAAGVALAELGDRASINLLLDQYAGVTEEPLRRQLSWAIVALHPPKVQPAKETVILEGIEWARMDALAAAGHPGLWHALGLYLGSEEVPVHVQERLLRLAHVCLAGPGLRLIERFHERVGPGPLPRILDEIGTWQTLPAPR